MNYPWGVMVEETASERPVNVFPVVRSGIFLPYSDEMPIEDASRVITTLEDMARASLADMRVRDPDRYANAIVATDEVTTLLEAAYGLTSFPLIAQHADSRRMETRDGLRINTLPLDITLDERRRLLPVLQRRVRDWPLHFFYDKNNGTMRHKDARLFDCLKDALSGLYLASLSNLTISYDFDFPPYLDISVSLIGGALALDTLLGDEQSLALLDVSRSEVIQSYLRSTVRGVDARIEHRDWFVRGMDRIAAYLSERSEESHGRALFHDVSGLAPSDLADTHFPPDWTVSAETLENALPIFFPKGMIDPVAQAEDAYKEWSSRYLGFVDNPENRSLAHLSRKVSKTVFGFSLPLMFQERESDVYAMPPLPRLPAVASVPPSEWDSATDFLAGLHEGVSRLVYAYGIGKEPESFHELQHLSTMAVMLYHASLRDVQAPMDGTEVFIENLRRSIVSDAWALDSALLYGDPSGEAAVHASIVKDVTRANIKYASRFLRHGQDKWSARQFSYEMRPQCKKLVTYILNGVRGPQLGRRILGFQPLEIPEREEEKHR